MQKRLPLTVIGGFLGAGKTTLLNHWLRHANGQRLAVLVNDFGALNIDASLIESTAGNTIALSNGCVCCQIGDDLSMALIEVLKNADALDAVVVEASGVSDPGRIAQLGKAEPQLYLDGVVVLVNADTAAAQSQDPLLADTLARQLTSAGLVVINHCDLATPEQLAQVRAWVHRVAPEAPVFETHQGEVPLALLSGLALNAAHQVQQAQHDHDHCTHEHDHDHHPAHDHAHDHTHDTPAHGEQFETWSCQPDKVFSVLALQTWLKQSQPGLLRLKGFVRAQNKHGETAWYEIQWAGRTGSWHATTAPASGAAVVAIGLRGQLPRAHLGAFFEGTP